MYILHQQLERLASSFPHQIAIEDDNNALSYKELEEKSNKLAQEILVRTQKPLVGLFFSHGYPPIGIRLVESDTKYDDTPNIYRASQLFHCDPYARKLVYVIVALRDITMKSGPFSFIPKDISSNAMEILGYREKKQQYRVTDEDMYKIVNKENVIPFCCPAGTILFIESSACFHYGSRDCIDPRYMMMYALMSPCRADFERVYPERSSQSYSTQEEDSLLRKLILDENFYDREW